MLKLAKNEDGVGALETVLIIVVIAVIAFVGYYIYHTSSKTNNTYNSQGQSTSNAKVNSYVGWKTYTDPTTNATFKYPSTWTLSTDGSGNTVLANSAKTVQVSYASTAASGSAENFFLANIHQLSKPSATLEVVGGYQTVTNAPAYALVDSAVVKSDGLKLNQPTSNVPAFTFNSGASSMVASDTASNASKLNTVQSKAWLREADGTQALLVLESYSTK